MTARNWTLAFCAVCFAATCASCENVKAQHSPMKVLKQPPAEPVSLLEDLIEASKYFDSYEAGQGETIAALIRVGKEPDLHKIEAAVKAFDLRIRPQVARPVEELLVEILFCAPSTSDSSFVRSNGMVVIPKDFGWGAHYGRFEDRLDYCKAHYRRRDVSRLRIPGPW